ncbi:hypothetical protein V6N13_081031 [Hibiscus sabdariffa]
MSTTERGRLSVLRIFKGRWGRTGHHATCGALPAAGPYLRLSRFQGGRTICTLVSLRASTRVSSGFAPLRHSSPSFGSRQACSHSNPSQKIKNPWSVFQDGPDGEPIADARSMLVPKHAETARAGFHDRGDDVSTGVSKAWASAATTIRVGPRPEPIGGPALSTAPRGATGSGNDGALTLSGTPFQGTWARSAAEDASLDYNSDDEGDGFSSWAIPVSHFATFFIDARAEISVAGSRFVYSRQSGHFSAAHAPRTGVQQLIATFSFRFLGIIQAGGCSFCRGDTGSRITGTGRGRGAMKRPHPLPLIFDNTFTGRSARQVQWTSRDVTGSEPRTSPRSEHFTGPFNRAGGTTRPIKARSASPTVGTSRPVLTVRRTGRPTPRSNYELFNCNNLIYTIGAGITAAAGTRLALQWILVKGFRLYSFQLPDS